MAFWNYMETREIDLIERQKMFDQGILADLRMSNLFDQETLNRLSSILDVGVRASSDTRGMLNRWILRSRMYRTDVFELVLSQFSGRGVNEYAYGVTYGKSFGERIVPTYELQGISRIDFNPKSQDYVRFIQEDDTRIATLVVNQWGGVAIRSELK